MCKFRTGDPRRRRLVLAFFAFILGCGESKQIHPVQEMASNTEMSSKTSLDEWLKRDDPELEAAIVADVGRHISALRSSGETFYGYAVLPGDYRTQPNPATLTVAFNRESDIDPQNAGNAYYRYSVDEWNSYVHDGFDASKAKLESSLKHFRSIHSRSPDSFELDEHELAFMGKTNRALLNAVLKLQRNGTLGKDTFAVVWLHDSPDNIMFESAKALNKPEVYRQFKSEFE